MSIAQFRMGDRQGAEESLRKSVELSGNHYAKGLALLAELLNSGSRFSEAESAARLAIAADESSARGHCQLARALSGLKRPSEAEAAARRALELEPANLLIPLVLGNIHLQEHDFAAAVRDFDSYLSRAPLGPQSDLVRKTRDQALRVLDAQQEGARIQTP
jgi:tetratricopeptide (TPR) repeat protein